MSRISNIRIFTSLYGESCCKPNNDDIYKYKKCILEFKVRHKEHDISSLYVKYTIVHFPSTLITNWH